MAGVIWLASYPKSGNTWLRLLLANLVGGGDQPARINNMGLNGRYLVKRDGVDEVTQIDSDLLSHHEADRLRPLLAQYYAAEMAAAGCDAFVKVHDAYRRLDDGTPLLGWGTARAALYIVRDPRDVAVSLAFHNNDTLDESIARVGSNDHTLSRGINHRLPQLPQLLSDWSSHVRSWTRQRDVETHVLRYEDLRADPVAVFSRAVAFLGLDATPEAVERAVRHADFAELQRQEAETPFRERLRESTAPFFRSGRAGGWVDSLSPEQAAAIVADHGEVMAEFGYA